MAVVANASSSTEVRDSEKSGMGALERRARPVHRERVGLRVSNLTIEVASTGQPIQVVNNVSWTAYKGETLAIVGESGSGKTVSSLAVLGLLPPKTARIVRGEIVLEGQDLLVDSSTTMHEACDGRVSMIYQNAAAPSHPSFTVGQLMLATLRKQEPKISRSRARSRCLGLMGRVGIDSPADVLREHPHQLTKRVRKLCLVVLAVLNKPAVVIADDCTSDLDPLTQADVLTLLEILRRETDAAIVLITHDLPLVAETADRVVVMYAGSVLESGPAKSVLTQPKHPYTAALVSATPPLDERLDRQVGLAGQAPDPASLPSGCLFQDRCALAGGRAKCGDRRPPLVMFGERSRACHFADEINETTVNLSRHHPSARETTPSQDVRTAAVLVVDNLRKDHRSRARFFGGKRIEDAAIDDVSFRLFEGRTLALIGEDGCGSADVIDVLLRTDKSTSGSAQLCGENLFSAEGAELRALRRQIQLVHRAPARSLNPRLTAHQLVVEPLRIQGIYSLHGSARARELLERVGLTANQFDRLPGSLSAGQRQRIAIARALVLRPKILILHDPVQGLDMTTQAQILNLLLGLQKEMGLSYLLISHQLAVVRQLADNVAVMFGGRIVEQGQSTEIYGSPRHPYTRRLLASVPGIGTEGQSGSADGLPAGHHAAASQPFSSSADPKTGAGTVATTREETTTGLEGIDNGGLPAGSSDVLRGPSLNRRQSDHRDSRRQDLKRQDLRLQDSGRQDSIRIARSVTEGAPGGCRFRLYCEAASERCALVRPALLHVGQASRSVACHNKHVVRPVEAFV